MTVEQKAKAYDEALERAKFLKENTDGVGAKDVSRCFEEIFPELKESEDERIRKEIISHLQYLAKYCQESMPNVNEWIAWLEKQGDKSVNIDIESIVSLYKQRLKSQGVIENSSLVNMCLTSFRRGVEIVLEKLNLNGLKKQDGQTSNKTEPKFKVAQWIVWQDKCYKVNYNDCGYELVDQNGLSTSLEYGTIDENAHLWTTQDAKDGDVLDANGAPFIYKKHDKDYVYFYCGINLAGEFIEAKGISTWNNNYKVYPATKEQRDLLFQRMKEAGYEWNAKTKELKIEQKPDWNEEDEKYLDAIEKLIMDSRHTRYNGVIRKDAVNWIKSIKDRVQPQPTWKPSDEQMWALSTLANTPRNASDTCKKTAQDLLEQLKKLKE